MHARLYPSSLHFSFEKYPVMCAPRSSICGGRVLLVSRHVCGWVVLANAAVLCCGRQEAVGKFQRHMCEGWSQWVEGWVGGGERGEVEAECLAV